MTDPYTLDADTTEVDSERVEKAITERLFSDDGELIFQLVVHNMATGTVVVDGVEIEFTIVIDNIDGDDDLVIEEIFDEEDTGADCSDSDC